MNKNYSSCCFTGYRPEKFPFEISKGDKAYISFENALFEQILTIAEAGCRTFYCGMAMGFDLIAAHSVITVKQAFKEPLKLVCVLPFKTQGEGFPIKWKNAFNNVLAAADEVICLGDEYFKGCYQKRNMYMVDNSDYVITWFDGQRGGTANTINYAKRKGRQIFNVYENSENTNVQIEFEIL